MMSTYTITSTFTRTHAKHLAAKVVTDLYQCAMFYDHPGEDDIANYETELIELLANEYVYTYEFGFKTGDKRLLSWHYTVGTDGGLHGDANAGNIYAKATLAPATYFNFLTPSSKWSKLTSAQQAAFEKGLPVQRTPGSSPVDGDGYWQVDNAYSAGGVRVQRKTFRPR
jgi:hypothetical protein